MTPRRHSLNVDWNLISFIQASYSQCYWNCSHRGPTFLFLFMYLLSSVLFLNMLSHLILSYYYFFKNFFFLMTLKTVSWFSFYLSDYIFCVSFTCPFCFHLITNAALGVIVGPILSSWASQVALGSGTEPVCQCRRCKRCRFSPWVRKISRGRA